jgi:hypothetical protein
LMAQEEFTAFTCCESLKYFINWEVGYAWNVSQLTPQRSCLTVKLINCTGYIFVTPACIAHTFLLHLLCNVKNIRIIIKDFPIMSCDESGKETLNSLTRGIAVKFFYVFL